MNNNQEIDNRQQIEKVLRESEKRLTQIIDFLPDATLAIDCEGRVTIWNRAMEKLTGVKAEDMVGKGNYEYSLPFYGVRRPQLIDLVFKSDEEIKKKYQYVRKEGDLLLAEADVPVRGGELRSLWGVARALYDSDGNVVGAIESIRDITDRKQAKDEINAYIHFLESLERVDRAIKRETDFEQMLSNILKTVFEIFDCDRAWLLYPCDPDAPSFRVPMEISRPEYPGAAVLNMDVPMSPGEARSMREALESDEPVMYTVGTERTVSTAEQFAVLSQIFFPVYPKIGKPWIFGMHQCSHPRNWTKEEQKLFKEISRRISDGLSSALFLCELQENEERFRATFEQAAVGMAHVSPDGRWLRVNQKLCNIVGYSRDELLIKTFLDITYHEDADASMVYFRQVLTGEIPKHSMEKRYIRKDGSLIWVNLTGSVVRNAAGESLYFIAAIEDIGKRKRAEEELNQYTIELARSNRELEQFAYVSSHDLQEPLRKIIAFGDRMKTVCATNLDSRGRDYLERMQNAAVRMRQLIEDLLAFSRITTKAHPFKSVNLTTVVQEVVSNLEYRIIEAGGRIEMGGLPTVLADRMQMLQLFQNLIANALKFHKEGIAPQIVIRSRLIETGYAEITIGDNGIGFDEKYLDRIFVPFQRLHTRNEYEGTGMGLAICHKIVERHGWTITAKSEPGKGATFVITIPPLK